MPSFDTKSQERAVDSQIRPDGISHSYDGKISTGIFSSTEFQAKENLDANGRLIDRTITYGSEADRAAGTNTGITVKFATGDGTEQEIQGVDRVTTKYDAEAQQYETKIHTVDGKDFIAQTDATGKVTSFREIKGVEQAAMVSPPVMSAEASMMPNSLIKEVKGAADTTYVNDDKQLESKTVFDDGGVLTHTEVNGAKRLTEVTDAAGRNTKLGWSEDGSRIDTVTTAEGTWSRNPENPTEWTNEKGDQLRYRRADLHHRRFTHHLEIRRRVHKRAICGQGHCASEIRLRR